MRFSLLYLHLKGVDFRKMKKEQLKGPLQAFEIPDSILNDIFQLLDVHLNFLLSFQLQEKE